MRVCVCLNNKKIIYLRRPGIEPGPRAWKARILTIELSTLVILLLHTIKKYVCIYIFHPLRGSNPRPHD